jgi:Arc/MetJ-type ribon-helix-helix transcriptional regulator
VLFEVCRGAHHGIAIPAIITDCRARSRSRGNRCQAAGWSLPAAVASALHALLDAVQQHEAVTRARTRGCDGRATRETAELRKEVDTLRALSREQAGELAALGEQLAREIQINTAMAEAARRHAEEVEQILLRRRTPSDSQASQDPADPVLRILRDDAIGHGLEIADASSTGVSLPPHREPIELSSARHAVPDDSTGGETEGNPPNPEALVETVLKLPMKFLRQYDGLVDAGQYPSRDEALRAALTSAILSCNARLASAAADSAEVATAPDPAPGARCLRRGAQYRASRAEPPTSRREASAKPSGAPGAGVGVATARDQKRARK